MTTKTKVQKLPSRTAFQKRLDNTFTSQSMRQISLTPEHKEFALGLYDLLSNAKTFRNEITLEWSPDWGFHLYAKCNNHCEFTFQEAINDDGVEAVAFNAMQDWQKVFIKPTTKKVTWSQITKAYKEALEATKKVKMVVDLYEGKYYCLCGNSGKKSWETCTRDGKPVKSDIENKSGVTYYKCVKCKLVFDTKTLVGHFAK